LCKAGNSKQQIPAPVAVPSSYLLFQYCIDPIQKKSLPQNTKTNGFAIPSLNQQARVLKPALFKINA
jgi:hypothetical protein